MRARRLEVGNAAGRMVGPSDPLGRQQPETATKTSQTFQTFPSSSQWRVNGVPLEVLRNQRDAKAKSLPKPITTP